MSVNAQEIAIGNYLIVTKVGYLYKSGEYIYITNLISPTWELLYLMQHKSE
jgi:hypothetical protein